MSSSEPCLRTSLLPLKPGVLATVQSLFSAHTCMLCACSLKVTPETAVFCPALLHGCCFSPSGAVQPECCYAAASTSPPAQVAYSA